MSADPAAVPGAARTPLERDLAPRFPRASWEGWFAITIGPPGAAVRWTKTHVFRSAGRDGWHPIAAVEGLRAKPGEVVTWVAAGDRVAEAIAPLSLAEARALAPESGSGTRGPGSEGRAPEREGDNALRVSVPGAVELSGGAAGFRLRRAAAAATLEVDTGPPGPPLVWARVPRTLTYVSWAAEARGAARFGPDATAGPVAGLALVEHAFGAHVPFDPARAVGGARWHWDVLRLPPDGAADGGSHGTGDGALAGARAGPPFLAALWLPFPFRGFVGARGGGRLPGGAFGAARPGALTHLASEEVLPAAGPCASERPVRRPARWAAAVELPGGMQASYEARARGPLVLAAPHAGLFGFDFALEAPRGTLEGTGFCECAIP